MSSPGTKRPPLRRPSVHQGRHGRRKSRPRRLQCRCYRAPTDLRQGSVRVSRRGRAVLSARVSVRVRTLPRHRQPHGFDNLNFPFDRHSLMQDGTCVAIILLPRYPIDRIHTGQFATVSPPCGYPGIRCQSAPEIMRCKARHAVPLTVQGGTSPPRGGGNHLPPARTDRSGFRRCP